MQAHTKGFVCALLAASAMVAPQIAQAKGATKATAREAQLEDRLARMEAELASLKADLVAAKGAQAAADVQTQTQVAAASAQAQQAAAVATTATATAKDATTRVAAVEKKPQPEGMRVGNTNIRIGGFLKMQGAMSHFDSGAPTTNTLGRDFYLPQTIPTATATSKGTTDTDLSAKQTRLWLNLDTTVAGHTVKGYLETDFQTTADAAQNVTAGGSQRTTNGYTLALRRGYLQVDKWTFGQDWTTFQYVAALPESTDFVGATEGTVFVRQPLVRYSTPLSKSTTLHVAVENPEGATATAGAAALVENGTDHLPDFTARLVHTTKMAEISVAALGRQVRVENAGIGATRGGLGASVAGKLFLNEAKTSDIRFMATYGQNISRYVGLNFAPDAVYLPTVNQLTDVKVFAALAAARVGITPTTRINLIGSLQNVSYDDSLTLAQIGAYNKRAWSVAANLFTSPVKGIDLGVEFRHGVRELVNGAQGKLDRVEFAAKYSF